MLFLSFKIPHQNRVLISIHAMRVTYPAPLIPLQLVNLILFVQE